MYLSNRLSLMCLVLLLTGCSHYITYYETEPPRIRLGEKQNSILFISRYDSSAVDFNQEKKIKVYREGYNKLVNGIIDGFDDSPITLTWKDSIEFVLPKNHRTIPRDTVKMICQQYNSSMLLVLENFDMHRDKEVNVSEDDEGNKTRTATFTVVANVPMSLYASDGFLLDSEPLRTERNLSTRQVLSGLLAIGPSLGNRGDEIYPMLSKLGREYAENFKSHEILQREKCFTNKEFKPLVDLIKSDQWVRARDFTVDLYNKSTDQQTKYRAAHNLYLINMHLRDYENARIWQSKL